MAASIQALISEAERRIGWADDAAHRLRVLGAMDEAERAIAQQGSQLYLAHRRTMVLGTGASSLALPGTPSIDFGKSMSLKIQGEEQGLRYYPHDEFNAATAASASYYSLRNDRPSAWTLARDASAGLAHTMFFDVPNATLGNVTLIFTGQMAPADLADSSSSFSLLPDGYEWSLLLGRAVAQLKKELSRPRWQDELAEVTAGMQTFFDGQRTTKGAPMGDSETQARKVYNEQLTPEA